MNLHFIRIILIFLCGLFVACTSVETDVTDNSGFQNLLESVVKIDVWEVSQKDGGNITERAIGSGVIISNDGMILTNAHVVNCYASRIIVTLANLEKVKAEFVGWDHWTDLAVIKLDENDLKNRNIKFSKAKFGNSENLSAGEIVYAVGTPHGFARTVTRGIVSNTNRFFEGTILDSGYETGNFNTWIQTDAAINPGNSGGPLARKNGEIVGINTREYSNSNNLGFAVPSGIAKKIIPELIEKGKVERGYIGITLAPLQDMETFFEIDANKGALVRNVDTLSPAALAGILAGDVLLKLDEEEIDGRFPEQIPTIMYKIADKKTGSEINLELLRDSKKIKKTLRIELLESRVGLEYALEKWGVGMRNITKSFVRESKIDTDSKLMVVGVRNGYPFDKANISCGDIIVSINRKKITTEAELRQAYKAYLRNPKKTLVEVLHDNVSSFHIVTPSEK